MKALMITVALSACLATSCSKTTKAPLKSDSSQILEAEVLYKEERFREGLRAIQPDLETIAYLFDGHMIFGLFRSGSSDRYLFVLQPSAIGELEIVIGDHVHDLSSADPLTAKIAGEKLNSDGTKEPSFDISTEAVLGRWLTIREGQQLRVEGSISHPAHRTLHMRFSPPTTISATLVPSKESSEQGVAPQSATRPESDSEGGDKPQTESEGRSR